MDVDCYLEVACFDVESLVLADRAGADRTEFCADRACGGVTPSFDELLGVMHLLRSPVHFMIRPRGGDFVYSDTEFEQMKQDIQMIKSASVPRRPSGVVFGILDAEGDVDVPRNSELVRLATPLSCTFHRAFDETRDPLHAFDDILACGFVTILTSGGAADAFSGTGLIGNLVVKSNASRHIAIMPGGGVRSSNIEFLREKTKARWYHSSAVVGDKMSVEEVSQLKRLLKAKK